MSRSTTIYRYQYAPLLPQGFHECGPTLFGLYRMPAEWIDTDNKVWSEPTHEYTEPFTQPEF